MRGMVVMLMVLAAWGCRAVRYVPVESRDSVRVEVRERTVRLRDTVWMEIPVLVERRETRDSVSHLENDYAVSDARVDEEGRLFHDLRTKAGRLPVVTEPEVNVRDTTVWRARAVMVPYPVERELTGWARWQMEAGGFALAGGGVWVVIGVWKLVREVKK